MDKTNTSKPVGGQDSGGHEKKKSAGRSAHKNSKLRPVRLERYMDERDNLTIHMWMADDYDMVGNMDVAEGGGGRARDGKKFSSKQKKWKEEKKAEGKGEKGFGCSAL